MNSVSKKSVVATMCLAGLIAGCEGQKQAQSSVEQVLNLTSSFSKARPTSFMEKLLKVVLPHAQADSPVIADSAGNDVIVDTAWISLQNIKLKADGSTYGSDEYQSEDVEFEGPFFIDLMSSTPFSVDLSEVPVQAYNGIFLKLHKESPLPESAPEALAENSIYLSGTVGGVRFTYAADDSTEIQIQGPQSLVPDTEKNLLVVFGFADMLAKIDLSSIAIDTDIDKDNKVEAVDPCPLIDPSAHDLYTCFRKGLEAQAKFGKDDGDMDLDTADELVHE